ncbi:protein naked cuticle homolog 2-like [Biomphalaria glabrata]|uniref:Protein naked cuticle homolog n=1 Tax=Biomphalaria glabrata TaxID=6526 RepID=A0A9W3AW51_BIOGL|nr:protein naked cuticle homolog 2-like [Biomphalaria glabrata]
MGKLQSKHECFYVSTNLNKTLQDNIWKDKTGFNLANYNMDETLSELSICLEEKSDTSPLRVELPPQKLDTVTSKLDHIREGCDKVNIEEIECGVQLEGSENSKQEWSFTLYDFDGHGMITKEDLASLLKALYDAVGSSIKLPPNGAKTLKLRLSVGQDCTAEIQRVSNVKSSERCRNTNKAPKNKVRDFSKLNNLMRTQIKCTNENQAQVLGLATLEAVSCKPEEIARKSLVPDHQELASLIHENMERNQIKQLRRHHSDRNEGQHHYKRRHRTTAAHCPVITAGAALTTLPTSSTVIVLGEQQEDRPKESQDRRNYYLDLAGVDNSKFQYNPTVPVAGSGCVRTGSGQHRSRSHDIGNSGKCDNRQVGALNPCDAVLNINSDKCDNVKRESERLAGKPANTKIDHLRSKSSDPQEINIGKKSAKPLVQQDPQVTSFSINKHNRFRPVSLPGHVPATISPHYHRRHRHREKDHDLAMQQVAQWIEREHAWDMDGERLVVQRHEHHHFHEHHHHHHYHHYHEA